MKTLKGLIATLFVVLFLAACGTQPNAPRSNIITGTATLVLPGHSKPTTVTYDIVDGLAMFEGDIILGKVDSQGSLIQSRNLRYPRCSYRHPSLSLARGSCALHHQQQSQ